MSEKYLIVVDMQEDFIYGSLGSPEARGIVPAVVEMVKNFDGTVVFTKDTHQDNYMDTQEGKFLPVPHCINLTKGWELIEPLEIIQKEKNYPVYTKGTFGCTCLAADLQAAHSKQEIASVEFIGVCTDICVASNALLLKAYLPEVPVIVHASCCAGVTPQKHEAALETMRSCQIMVR